MFAGLCGGLTSEWAWLKETILAIGKTGMAVAAMIGITLDNLIPGTASERGLSDPAKSTSNGFESAAGNS